MEYTVLLLLFWGVLAMIKRGDLSGYSIRELTKRYPKDKENDVALALLDRYQKASRQEQGDILWSLLSPHKTDLSRIIASMREEPDEELQKLFIKLHQLFLRGKFPEKNWKYWLARILRNDLINKKKQKNPIVSIPIEILPEAEAPEDYDENESNTKRLHQAISVLADRQKQAVELRYLQKQGKLMTYKEIAGIMDCSVGQVHGYLDRAKENLRNQLNELIEP